MNSVHEPSPTMTQKHYRVKNPGQKPNCLHEPPTGLANAPEAPRRARARPCRGQPSAVSWLGCPVVSQPQAAVSQAPAAVSQPHVVPAPSTRVPAPCAPACTPASAARLRLERPAPSARLLPVRALRVPRLAACAPRTPTYAPQRPCPAPCRGPVTVLQYNQALPQSQYSELYCDTNQPPASLLQYNPSSLFPAIQYLYCNTLQPSSLFQVAIQTLPCNTKFSFFLIIQSGQQPIKIFCSKYFFVFSL